MEISISGQLRDKYGVVVSSQGVDERFKKKAKKEANKKGRQLSNKFMASICLNVYVTNIAPETLGAPDVRTL